VLRCGKLTALYSLRGTVALAVNIRSLIVEYAMSVLVDDTKPAG
jgi:hypothetical protein